MIRQRPNSKNEVTPHILTDPIGVDTIVTAIQQQLSDDLGLGGNIDSYLDKSFNRAEYRSRVSSSKKEVIRPCCWIDSGKDEFDMIGNDNWRSYTFFTSSGKDKVFDFHDDNITDSLYTSELSLYCWFKSYEIDATLSQGQVIQKVKRDLLQSIGNTVFLDSFGILSIPMIETNPNQVFKGFTYDEAMTQYVYYPNGAIRIDLEVMYTYNICS